MTTKNNGLSLSIDTPSDKTVTMLGGSSNTNDKAAQKRLKSVRDDSKKVRTSIEMDADDHRRFKIYLANKGTTYREEVLKYIKKCIKDID